MRRTGKNLRFSALPPLAQHRSKPPSHLCCSKESDAVGTEQHRMLRIWRPTYAEPYRRVCPKDQFRQCVQRSVRRELHPEFQSYIRFQLSTSCSYEDSRRSSVGIIWKGRIDQNLPSNRACKLVGKKLHQQGVSQLLLLLWSHREVVSKLKVS